MGFGFPGGRPIGSESALLALRRSEFAPAALAMQARVPECGPIIVDRWLLNSLSGPSRATVADAET